MAVVAKKRVKKPIKKTAKAVTRKRKIAKPVVAVPVITPLVPVLPAEVEHQFKTTEHPSSRLKMWLAVLVSMAVIVCFWAYSLSQTLLSSNAISASVDSTNIDAFVTSLSDDFAKLQSGSDDFANQVEDQTDAAELETEPTTQALDSLFSDIE